MISGIAAAAAGLDAQVVSIAASTGANAAENNFLGHEAQKERDRLRAKSKSEGLTQEEAAQLVALERADQLSNELLNKYRSGASLTKEEASDLSIYLGAYQLQDGRAATEKLVKYGAKPTYGWPYAGSNEAQKAYVSAHPDEFPWYRLSSPYASGNAETFLDAWRQIDPTFQTSNTDALPSVVLNRRDYSTIDALRNSPVIATGTYLFGIATNADKKQLNAATAFASNLSDIGASFILPKVGLTPALGVTAAEVRGGANGGVNGIRNGGTIELFTDASGPKVPGAIGVGPKDVTAVATDARSMPNIPNNSQSTVVANNPFIPPQSGGTLSMMDYLPEAARITQPGGKIVINGNGANPYFTSIPTTAQLDALGLKVQYQGALLPEYQGLTFLRTDGSPIANNTMKTIVFIKK